MGTNIPVQARAQAAAIGGRVSGHSLRTASAQSLAALGALLPEMQRDDPWKSSEMPAPMLTSFGFSRISF